MKAERRKLLGELGIATMALGVRVKEFLGVIQQCCADQRQVGAEIGVIGQLGKLKKGDACFLVFVLIVIGAVLWVLGSVGRPVGGRRYWY